MSPTRSQTWVAGAAPWHFFHLRPLPQVQRSFRPRAASSEAYRRMISAGRAPWFSSSHMTRIGSVTWWKKAL